ncbi:hypothetical protein FraQA3DRAFT_1304 [Frankia sp. QA3]|nr:hypothetical protein FraQA3DRAFT_1304 [Frankia sp. QA3]
MAALDRVEFDGRDEETVVEELVRTRGVFDSRDAPAHSGLVAWSVEAFRNYRAAWRTHQVAVTARCTRPVRSAWKVVHHRDVPDHRGVVRYEQTCWGRRYESDDGSVREMWLLGFTTPKERPSVVYAAAANVAAFGGSVSPDQVRQPDRVRVVVFGAMSPIAHQLPEWTAEQIRRRARDEVAPRLVAVVDGTERRAGRDCAQCPQTPGCAALPTVDLLPNLPAAHGRRQMLSVTDLRLYQSCPARYHLLRQLRIRDVEAIESQAIAVGRAVDTALRNRHVNGCRTHRCESGQPLDEAVNALPEESRRSAARMLDHHSTLCPFPDVEAHDSEQRNIVSVYDDRLDVVFIAAPDLLYPRSGGWVWRETKTSKRRLRRDRPLMRQVPQLALAVLLLASGSLGRDVARSRVEFEQLRSDGCVLEELDPGRPTVVTEAREVIGEMVGPLLVDTAFAPTPGRDCASCEVRRWCGPGSQHVAKQAGVPLHDR